MAKITFDNGITVNFQGTPTDADIEEVYRNISTNKKAKFSSIAEAQAALSKERSNLEYITSPLGRADIFGGAFLKPFTQTILGAGKTLTGGLSGAYEQATGLAEPNNVNYQAGQLFGYIPLTKAAGAVAGQIATKGAAGLAARTAAQALAGGYGNSDNRVLGAAIGGAGNIAGEAAVPLVRKGLSSTGNMLKKLPMRFSSDKEVAFAEKIRKAFYKTKSDAVNKFGNQLDDLVKNNPNKNISIQENESIVDILTDPELPVEARNIFNKTPILRDIVAGKKDSVNVKEAQEIINYLNTKVPANIKANNLDIIDMINEIKVAQSSAFPEKMASLRSEYARVKDPFNKIKNKFKFDQLLSNIDQGFGKQEGQKALKELFRDNPELLKEMGGYRGAGKLIKGLKIAGKLTVGAAATAGGGKVVYDYARNR